MLRNTLEGMVDLDGFLVCVAETDAGAAVELVILAVTRCDKYGLEAALGLGIIVTIDLHLILIFLIVYDTAVRHLDLIAERHLAARSQTVGEDRAARAVRKVEHELYNVVVFDRQHAGGVLRVGALGHNDLCHAADLGNIADEVLRQGKRVACQITQRTGRGRGLEHAPLVLLIRIVVVVLIVHAAEVDDLAKLARRDQLLDILLDWVADVIEADRSHNAGVLDYLGRINRLLRGHGQRFFAVDVLAVLCCLDRNRAVRSVRRGDVHQFNFGVRNDLVPVGRPALEAVFLRKRLRVIAVHIGYNDQLRYIIIAENVVYRLVCGGMGAAHEACADQSDLDLLHIVSFVVKRGPAYGWSSVIMNSALPLSEFRKEVVYIGAVDDGRVGGIERINGLALDGVECACYTVIAHLVSADIDRCGDRAFLDRRCTRDTAEAADNNIILLAHGLQRLRCAHCNVIGVAYNGVDLIRILLH